MALRWWGGACGGVQRPAVRVSEEAGRVVVLRTYVACLPLQRRVEGSWPAAGLAGRIGVA